MNRGRRLKSQNKQIKPKAGVSRFSELKNIKYFDNFITWTKLFCQLNS